MPYFHSTLEQRLSTCDHKLEALFESDTPLDEQVRQQINEVKRYYNRSYIKATSAKTVEAIAASYESFVNQLTQVKNGNMTTKEATESLLSNSQSRKLNVLFHNLCKACELLFWSATAFSLYMGIYGLVLPVLIIQPYVGVAVGITIVGALLASVYKALSCVTEFKSLNRHNTEHTNEVNLVYFFQPLRKEPEITSLAPEETKSMENACLI